MSVQSAVGTVDIASTDGVGTQISETGLGFTPKIIKFWWSGRSDTSDAVGSATQRRGVGFAAGSTDRHATAARSDDGASPSSSGRRMVGDACIILCDTAGADDGAVDLSSFDSDGFTLEVDTQLGVDLRVHYIALGGSDLLNATTGFATESNADAASTSVTGVGFEPNALLLATNWSGETTLPHGGTGGRIIHGMAAGGLTASEQHSMSAINKDGNDPSVVWSYGSDDRWHVGAWNTDQGTNSPARVSSFDADGFTVNWINYSTNNADQALLFAAIDATNVQAGTFSTSTTQGNDISESGFGFEPSAVLFASRADVEAATDDTAENQDARIVLGAAAGASEQGGQATLERDGVSPTEVFTAIEHDAVYANIATDGTTQGVMSLKSLDSGGFTVTMDEADAAANFVGYLAFGPAETPTPLSGSGFGLDMMQGGL